MQRRQILKYLSGCVATAAVSSSSRQLFAAKNAGSTSGDIAMNQIGFLPSAGKFASVRSAGSQWRLKRSSDGGVVLHGSLSDARKDEASGDMVRIAEFSQVKVPGKYFVELDSGGRSADFLIGNDVYRNPLWQATRAFYGQRCNCNVDLGDGYAHPKCHMEAAFHPSSGKTGKFGDYGGWHDAGDYGRYAVNSGISTGTLLWAWEAYARTLRKIDLKIPESGGKLPDFLAEIQWNLKWMLSLQDSDGGVWQKQTSEQFAPFVMPQDDHSISYVIGTGAAPFKSTCATADLAAVAAIAARCYGEYDAGFAQQCLTAARRAWKWCMQNPAVVFENPPGIATGVYGDGNCMDEIAWASAELWRTTGEKEFEQAFLARLPHPVNSLTIQAPAWDELNAMACWTYAMAERKSSAAVTAQIRKATLTTAREMVRQSGSNKYGCTLAPNDYIWGSNGVAANHSLLLLIADGFERDKSFTDCAWKNLDYILGRNCFGISWVTQLGMHPFMHPHHRPSVADGLVNPWSGLMSGGPNRHPADAVARKLPQQPPMRMWVDDWQAYSCNEVAINWNAPLVYVLAAANHLEA